MIGQSICMIYVIVIYLSISHTLSLYYWLNGLNEKSVLPGGCLYQKPSHPMILSEQHTSLSQYHPDGILERWNLVNESCLFKFSNINKHFLSYYCTTIVTAGTTEFVISAYLLTITIVFPMTLESTYISKLVDNTTKTMKAHRMASLLPLS